MVDRKIVDEWLEKAEEDYLFTSKHLQDEESFFAPLCFHCQQAAEKYLKAYIVARGLSFRKVHDLVELLNVCQSHDATFAELDDDTKRLTRFYIDTRYPAIWPVGYTKDDAVDALSCAGRIREFVKSKLSG